MVNLDEVASRVQPIKGTKAIGKSLTRQQQPKFLQEGLLRVRKENQTLYPSFSK